uniref:Uncharacterized protein n=1 Tax=Setaria viridis TaxID=4556 RepID=A0A4U6T1B7_SETVI|nr:hypothetical protein SEVIR_9G296850v2 [Setaria viridis]
MVKRLHPLSFPPRLATLDSGGSVRCRSAGSTNQPEPMTIEFPTSSASNHPPVATTKGTKKQTKQKDKPKPKGKKQAKKKAKQTTVLFDSPAMGTRSKKVDPCSPAMSTRSRRRLSL